MKSKTTMLSSNNDSSIGPSNSTHRSGTTLMTGTTKVNEKSMRMLDTLKN